MGRQGRYMFLITALFIALAAIVLSLLMISAVAGYLG